MRIAIQLVFLATGCGGDGKDGDTGEVADLADADTDTDADADADSDTDVDTATPPTEDTTTPGEPEPTCNDAGLPLTESAFATTYLDKYCWYWAACGNIGPCPADPGECPDMDATAGCACLDATWTCDGVLPVPAPACFEACDDRPSGGSGWWTYGGSGGWWTTTTTTTGWWGGSYGGWGGSG